MALIGSSQRRRLGGTMTARAMATRWHWPPESSDGRASAIAGDEADEVEGLGDAPPPLGGREAERTEPLADLVADPEPRRQRGDGILEDDLRLAAVGARDVAPVRDDQAGSDAEDGRLAGAALADQRHRLAPRDPEVDAVEHAMAPAAAEQRRARRVEALRHVGQLERKAGSDGGGRRPGFAQQQSGRGRKPPRPYGNRPHGRNGPASVRAAGGPRGRCR